MRIVDHKLAGVPYKPARVIGGTIKPSLIILHDTAGRLDKGNSVKWFQSAKCTTSAHIIVERDGSVVQMVPFNKKAAHAGQSTWRGKTFCNSFSIGIEIVNPGKLDQTGKSWFGQCFEGVPCATQEHGDGKWMEYTPEQISAVTDICRAICEAYADVNEIVGHFHVSPGRKVDPNPTFPWQEVVHNVFTADPPPEMAVAAAEPPMAAMVDVGDEDLSLQKPAHQSTTIQAGGVTSLASAYSAQAAMKEAITKANTSDGFDWSAFLIQLLTSEVFLASMLALGAAVYVIMHRWGKPDIKKRRTADA